MSAQLDSQTTSEQLLREQRDRFRFATEAADLGYWFCDLPFDKLIWDDRVKEHFWLPPGAGVDIELFYALIHPEDREKTRAAIDESIRTKTRYKIEYRTLGPDGAVKWIRAIGRTNYDADGNPIHFDGITLDVSDQRRAEKALMDNEKVAAVGRLASSIAHEINNPLEALTNLLFLAQNSTDLQEIRSLLDTAERELRRVSGITTETLKFHRQSSRPTAASSEALIFTVLSIYQGRIMNAAVQVHQRMRATQPVLCFEGEIRQVLSNLLSNALDAMNASGGSIYVRTNMNACGLTFTVADTGPGMTADTLRRLFDPFFTTKGMNGTGLGLWISKQIVDRHRGLLTVRSSTTPGRTGTVFRLFLPFATPELA